MAEKKTGGEQSADSEVLSTRGTRCNTTAFNTILYPRLYKNNIDITDSIDKVSSEIYVRVRGLIEERLNPDRQCGE